MVILTKYTEMDDDGPRNKRQSIFRRIFWSNAPQRPSPLITNPPQERRPLRSVPVIGPKYKVDPEVLVKDFVEKETKYMGTIDDVCTEYDTSDRCAMLSLIDEKRKVNQLPRLLSYRNDVIISFSVHNIKISCRDGEELIHRIPTHKIAATGFMQDDREVFLFIKFGSKLNNNMCNISFFSCQSTEIAEELCSLTHQLFQLVFTESTMDFFDKSIQDGAVTPKHHSYSTDDSIDKRNTIKLNSQLPISGISVNGSSMSHGTVSSQRGSPVEENSFNKEGDNSRVSSLSPSSAPSSMHRSHNHGYVGMGFSSPISSASTPSSPTGSRRRKNRRSESSSGSYSQTSSHQLQLKEYIAVLKERLTSDELTLFAQDLHSFRNKALPIEKFCDHLMQIYKEHRKSLLLGMRHFIHSNDREYFEKFLLQHDVTTEDDTKRWWDRRPESRTTSETEESSAHSNQQTSELLAGEEVSSNSDQTSTSQGEGWESTMSEIQQLKLSETEGDSSTLKPEQTVEPTPERPPGDDDVMIGGTEEGDSPLLRSGENPESCDPNLLSPRREISLHRQRVFKKKSRGKSPSTAEFGAPYPSIGVSDGDEAERTNPDNHNAKKSSKKKSKEKSGSSDERDIKKKRKPRKPDLRRLKSEEPSTSRTDPPTPTDSHKSADDDVTPVSATPSTGQRKAEHRKKKRHKPGGGKGDVTVGVVTQL